MGAAIPDEVYGYVADNMDRRVAEVALELGIEQQTVLSARRRIIRGIPLQGTRAPWTSDEDDIIRAHPTKSASELAEILVGRSWQAIKLRRSKIAALRGLPKDAYRGDPMSVAGRPLLARTCSNCGVTRSGSSFPWRKSARVWSQTCVHCRATGAKARWSDRGYSTLDRNVEKQRASLPTASRAREPYSKRDMSVLAREDLTVLEKAIRLERTYYGANCAVQKFGFRSAPPPLAARPGDEWKIHNPNQPAMVAS